jgi:hypothetical protein
MNTVNFSGKKFFAGLEVPVKRTPGSDKTAWIRCPWFTDSERYHPDIGGRLPPVLAVCS